MRSVYTISGSHVRLGSSILILILPISGFVLFIDDFILGVFLAYIDFLAGASP